MVRAGRRGLVVPSALHGRAPVEKDIAARGICIGVFRTSQESGRTIRVRSRTPRPSALRSPHVRCGRQPLDDPDQRQHEWPDANAWQLTSGRSSCRLPIACRKIGGWGKGGIPFKNELTVSFTSSWPNAAFCRLVLKACRKADFSITSLQENIMQVRNAEMPYPDPLPSEKPLAVNSFQ